MGGSALIEFHLDRFNLHCNFATTAITTDPQGIVVSLHDISWHMIVALGSRKTARNSSACFKGIGNWQQQITKCGLQVVQIKMFIPAMQKICML